VKYGCRFDRPFWRARLQDAWGEAPIAWHYGARRCGKATLAEKLVESETLFVHCDLPTTEELVRDPQMYFKGCKKPTIVFDEIQQLQDPSRVLKIGADPFSKIENSGHRFFNADGR